MSDNNTPPEIDPIEIEINLINELIENNIVIIIHQNGMSIMMNDDVDNRSNEQMKLFSRLYVASNPSFVLRFFLLLEVTLLLVWESMEDLYHRWMK